MKAKLKRKNRRLSSLLFWLFAVSLSLSAADLIDQAGALEREGRTEEARTLYIKWLSLPDSAGTEGFGRILVHTLRMPAPLDEDLDLIERHLDRMGPGSDRDQVLETAVLITELSGHQLLKERYLSLLTPDRTLSRDSAVLRLKKLPDTKYGILKGLKVSTPQSDLAAEIRAVHDRHPEFLFQPDWLFSAQRLLAERGFSEDAEEFRDRLRKDFPYSVEVALLDGKVSLLRGPEAYLDESLLSISDVQLPAGSSEIQDTGIPGPGSTGTLYQAGAFRSAENANQLMADLTGTGLSAFLREEEGVYKVIVESRDEKTTREILEAMDISAFRIAP